MTELSTLYHSDRLTLRRYDCDHAPGDGNVEEWPDRDELVLVIKGVYQKRSSDGSAVLDPSRVALFRKGQPYSISHPVHGGDQSIILEFNRADLCAAFGTEAAANGTALHRVPATFAVTPLLLLLAGRLCRGASRSVQHGFDVEETAYELLHHLSVAASQMDDSRTARRSENLRALDVAAFVSSRYTKKLSLGEIAETLNVSPFHLCRTFHAATGTTIHRYITTLRMSDAALRLWDYRNNLTELALELGYSSHSHFSSVFRHFFSTTPSRLIKQYPGYASLGAGSGLYADRILG